MKLSLQWKWFCGLTTLLGVLLLVINLGIDFFLPPFLVKNIRTDLERNAIVIREFFTAKSSAKTFRRSEVNAWAHEISKKTGLRVTVIAPDGVVIGESDVQDAELAHLENHLYRPEVQKALEQAAGIGSSVRHSDTVGVDLMYLATAVRDENGSLLSVVRVALPMYQVIQTTDRVEWTVAAASLIVLIAALPLLFWMARRVSVPIEAMREMAMRVAKEDFSIRAPEKVSGELGELGRALNRMSGQLEARLRELAEEKSELNATLANMIEGVLVVDVTGKIRLANQALRQQFDLTDLMVGKTVLETFRNAQLQEMITQALASGEVQEYELNFFGKEESIFEVNAANLRGPGGQSAGVVVVFHDITRIKKLENLRKEFVANVSHELRTPLSIIKGYVETLLDEKSPDRVTTKQFLDIIQKHAIRLESLIGDLLSISEMESSQPRLQSDSVSLHDLAGAVIEELAHQAREKSITISQEISERFPLIWGDAERLHQVFFNLIDNAIKYTPAGGQVIVSAREEEREIVCCVSDNGPGITAEHLPRIFERFYRVDKARSRELGGTGLGLSIVKHIVQAHGGRVWVESELSKGSCFFFSLPKNRG